MIPDFKGVKDFADIQQRFIASAQSIMRDHLLSANGQEFEVTSLELYLKLHDNRDVWWDSSTDKDEVAYVEQCKRGTWYVRQRRGQRYWRVDITAGDLTSNIQAGILIRQLDGLGGRNPGSAVALHRIVRGRFGNDKFRDEHLGFIQQFHGRKIDGSDGSPLTLKPRKSAGDARLGVGKRFGLSKSDAKNFEGISIREAPLRVSVWRRWSDDCEIT